MSYMLTMTVAGPAGSLGYYLQGLEGEQSVMALQNALNAAGFNAGTADGVANPRTKAAFIDFVIKAASVAGQFTQVVSQIPSEVKTALDALLATDTWLRNNAPGGIGLSTAIRNEDQIRAGLMTARGIAALAGKQWLVDKIDQAISYIGQVGSKMSDLLDKHAGKLTMAVGVYTSLTGGAGGGGGGSDELPGGLPSTQPVVIKNVTAVLAKIVPKSPLPGYVPPTGTEYVPPPKKYQPGSIARFNVTRGVWSVYAPRSAGLGYGVYPNMMGLGAEPVVEPPAPGPKVGEELTPEAARVQGATPATETERDRAWYKSPWFIGGTIAVVAAGAGGYVLLRRKRRTT